MPIGAQYIYIFSFKSFIDQCIYNILCKNVLLTINKCLIQRRKLSFVVAYRDYIIFFTIIPCYKVAFYYYCKLSKQTQILQSFNCQGAFGIALTYISNYRQFCIRTYINICCRGHYGFMVLVTFLLLHFKVLPLGYQFSFLISCHVLHYFYNIQEMQTNSQAVKLVRLLVK